ncbi:MAG: polysaccharide pyruvyl transferase family protein [Kiritimatiellia bacterium]
MNLLLINQPVSNRGDEAAHRGLMRALCARYPDAKLTVAFLGVDPESARAIQVAAPNVEYVLIPLRRSDALRIPVYASRLHLRGVATRLHPAYRRLRQLMRRADYVVNAPGGICMGGFQNWGHVFHLEIARDCRKPVAYYSRSFGPFRERNWRERLFKRLSLDLLRSFDFLAIRDAKSMALADELGLRYVAAIDAAFLDVPAAAVPPEAAAAIGTAEYAVFVPNSLVWHVDFRRADAGRIDQFYLAVLDRLCARTPGAKVVMLPQLYGVGERGDFRYFEKLKAQSAHRDRIVVLPETCGSDVQQAIIARSRCMVGARYHSIVFALNNRVPFVSLSYEHKMPGLLAILGQEERSVDVRSLGQADFDEAAGLREVEAGLDRPRLPDAVAARAQALAQDCFQALCRRIDACGGRNAAAPKTGGAP